MTRTQNIASRGSPILINHSHASQKNSNAICLLGLLINDMETDSSLYLRSQIHVYIDIH